MPLKNKIKPLEILTEEYVEKLRISGEIALFAPKLNHKKREYKLIIYNDENGAILYEFDKDQKIYRIK